MNATRYQSAFGVTVQDGSEGIPVPTEFEADTVKVYAVPFFSPLTVMGLCLPETLMRPGYDVTVYLVTGVVPCTFGAVKLTLASPLPAVAVTPVGGSGMRRLVGTPKLPAPPPPPPAQDAVAMSKTAKTAVIIPFANIEYLLFNMFQLSFNAVCIGIPSIL
jgi:hypothetical protein